MRGPMKNKYKIGQRSGHCQVTKSGSFNKNYFEKFCENYKKRDSNYLKKET